MGTIPVFLLGHRVYPQLQVVWINSPPFWSKRETCADMTFSPLSLKCACAMCSPQRCTVGWAPPQSKPTGREQLWWLGDFLQFPRPSNRQFLFCEQFLVPEGVLEWGLGGLESVQILSDSFPKLRISIPMGSLIPPLPLHIFLSTGMTWPLEDGVGQARQQKAVTPLHGCPCSSHLLALFWVHCTTACSGKNTDPGGRQLGLQLFIVWPWAGSLTFLHLIFFICKMLMKTVLTLDSLLRNKDQMTYMWHSWCDLSLVPLLLSRAWTPFSH